MSKSPSYTFSGEIISIGEREQKGGNFTSRNFVVCDNAENYAQNIGFQAVQDRCDILDNFKPGDFVDVSFDLRGREWNGKNITNLNAWKIVPAKGEQQPQAAQAKPSTNVRIEPADFDLSHSAQGTNTKVTANHGAPGDTLPF